MRLLVTTAVGLTWFATSAVAEDVFYVCEDKTELTATFRTDPNSVDLVFNGSNVHETLPQVLSADGGRYAGGGAEFWIKGKQARLTTGQSTTVCQTKR
jgi:membrane-bound inhibitor of C-type lysozyme